MTRPRRGGLGVRHAQSARQEGARKYRLNGVPAGSIISECLDKYGRWEYGYRLGALLRNGVENVTVQWQGEEEFTYYNSGDARYKVDRNLWRIMPPPTQNIFDVLSGKSNVLGTLTSPAGDGSIASSPARGDTTEENDNMATRKKASSKPTKPAPEPEIEELDDELDPDLAEDLEAETADEVDIEEDDDVEEVDDPPAKSKGKADKKGVEAERETYTPKQIATRIGTDAKTLRKFFRSAASTVEPVGQGGRYVFDAADLPKIKAEFEKQASAPKAPRAGAGKSTTKGKKSTGPVVEVEDDDEVLELDDEPTDADIEELDDEVLELDDDIEEED